MTTKTCVWIGLFIGTSIGSAMPFLWQGDPFSISAILLSAGGGLAGIFVGYKIGNALFG